MLSGISIWSLLLILLIVVLLFGTRKLKTLGSDLGEAVRGFRRSVGEESGDAKDADASLSGVSSEPSSAKQKSEQHSEAEADPPTEKPPSNNS